MWQMATTKVGLDNGQCVLLLYRANQTNVPRCWSKAYLSATIFSTFYLIEEFFAELKAFIERNWQVYEANPDKGFDSYLE
jgi:hypothetical protein